MRSSLHSSSISILTNNHLLPIMVFIFGINFNEGRTVIKSLQSFYGIGPQVCRQLMAKFNIHKLAKIGELRDKQINGLADQLGTMTLENDLRRQMQNNITRLRDMGTYRGRRHAMSLPARGQRTRTQIRTARKLNRVDRRG